ncbi:MAG: hypothetical protein ACK5LV_08240 [Lachnospirales bacterium]
MKVKHLLLLVIIVVCTVILAYTYIDANTSDNALEPFVYEHWTATEYNSARNSAVNFYSSKKLSITIDSYEYAFSDVRDNIEDMKYDDESICMVVNFKESDYQRYVVSEKTQYGWKVVDEGILNY